MTKAVRTFPVSVVIPVLNEAENIGGLVGTLKRAGAAEIIVVDGRSRDGSARVALQAGADRVVRMAPGRGAQLHAGAMLATQPVLWFLHADSLVRAEMVRAVAALGQWDGVAMGCFSLRFLAKGRLFRLYEACARVETPLTTFGDQGFFVRSADYLAAGGFPDWPLFEDVEFRRRMRRLGRVAKVPMGIVTSARRFARLGILRTQMINAGLVLLFFLGVSPYRLDRLYRGQRGPAGQATVSRKWRWARR